MDAIRRARAEDADTIDRLVEEAYAHYPGLIGRRPAPMDADHAREIAEKEVWVRLHEDEVEGVLVLRHEEDETWVDNLAVAPCAQGRGVARALLDHAAIRATAHGVHEMRLLTHELMSENRAMYEHLGWEQIEKPADEQLPRVHFRKRVDPHP